MGDRRARQRLDLGRGADRVGHEFDMAFEEFGAVGEGMHLGALHALDQHLDGAVGQLQQLQHLRQGSDLVDGVDRRIVIARVLLRHQQDALVLAHHFLERTDGFLAADEKRHDHVREDDNVAQRQHGHRLQSAFGGSFGCFCHSCSFRGAGRHGVSRKLPCDPDAQSGTRTTAV